MQVMVSMYSGGVDLYGSDASNTTPNATSCQYFSASGSNEYINIPEGSGCSVASPCTYYFSTTPFLNQNSSYMILPSFAGSPVPLADGTPVDDSLETNEDKSYTFQWTPQTASSTLNIEVEAVSGVPYTSIFIGTVRARRIACACMTEWLPSALTRACLAPFCVLLPCRTARAATPRTFTCMTLV
ncbi:hypothetical protein EON62_00195 [archaeon]|nr:MAG: hypothetical protein EON62_00195 [archaeon]